MVINMNATENKSKITAHNIDVFYGTKQALFGVSLDILDKNVTSFIGPSGCGKSTLLRCINRMNDLIDGCKIKGSLHIDDQEINDTDIDVVALRKRIGMVFQKPNPFPKSIYDNIAYGPRIHNMASSRRQLDDIVEDALRKAALWEEVRDRLKEPGTSLSGGQQQRLCIARAIAARPEVLLMDEPCSALDPIASAHIEQLILELKKEYTIIIVTHSMQQASRISDHTAFFHLGELVEYDVTKNIFDNPQQERTQQYIGGKFG